MNATAREHHTHGEHVHHAPDHHAPAAHAHHTGHTHHTAGAHGAHGHTPDAHAHHTPDAHAAHTGTTPGGLQITEAGYTLALETPIVAAGVVEFRFRILGPDGAVVTDFAPIHERELHLIVARRELTGFQHVHPVRDEHGIWSIRLDLAEPGAYRVFTDIAPSALGHTLTLGADLAVAGNYAPRPAPVTERTITVDDYHVTVEGDLVPGAGRTLTFTLHKDGAPVTDLDPYLGAYGHLVVLRAGDLAYIHVHPSGEPGDGITPAGPGIEFHTVAPGPGTYRLFLDFRHRGTVRTAAFTLNAPAAA
ncbi:hypothetical protein IU448_18455 [Nocardia flavorosea]|uniref:hypothetical protein n=1 Tax=Nocardia flavorosea TaxID=53429 RepID=UPI001893B1D7|nr:hypothetical protein [Nocardia flavorosea]MBF6350982.1 hypothetical protein [Nocardia flavorosea]